MRLSPVGPRNASAGATPVDQITQVTICISQICLNNNAGMGPIFELVFAENGFEQFESRVFERVAFHVEIDKRAELACASKKRTQLGSEMGNSIRRSGRIHLRIKRGDFD